MNQIHKNNRYENPYGSNQYNDGVWVYYNGELYHAGIKGMQWGKHLPGTTWWKETVDSYNKANKTTTSSGLLGLKKTTTNPSQIKANLYAAGQAAKLYGGYIGNNAKVLGQYAWNKGKEGATKAWNASKAAGTKAWNAAKNGTSRFYNTAKGYSQAQIAAFKESARKSYVATRRQVQSVLSSYHTSSMTRYSSETYPKGSDTINYLASYVNKELQEACSAYSEASSNGPLGKQLNAFIQNAQFDVVKGSARLLDAMGLDDEVAAILDKIMKKK